MWNKDIWFNQISFLTENDTARIEDDKTIEVLDLAIGSNISKEIPTNKNR